MLKQIQAIRDWCKERKIWFWNCDVEEGIFKARKIPCSLDKGYRPEDDTLFISGFSKGSYNVKISYGGLKCEMKLKQPIEEIPTERIIKNWLPSHWKCPRCNKLNLNLRTDDNHKTYVCPNCYRGEK